MEEANYHSPLIIVTIRLSEAFCIVLAALAAISISGYFLNLPYFYRLMPNGPATNLMTALSIGLTAIAILLNIREKTRLSYAVLLVTTIILVCKVLMTIVHIEFFDILQSYIINFHQNFGDNKPNHMGTNTLWMMLFVVTSLWVSFRQQYILSQIVSLLALLIPLTSIFGYIFHIPSLHGDMSLNTIVGGTLLIIVTLGINAQHGLLEALLSTSTSGKLARRQCLSGCLFIALLASSLVYFKNAITLQCLFTLSLVATFGFVLVLVLSSTLVHLNIERKRRILEIKLIHDAQYDPLTGVYNRLAFGEETQKALLRQARNHEHICILLIDIDLFKHVNDTYGHAIGDRVLCSVAESIKQSVRATDIVCRYGGEEFSVLLPNVTLERGCYIAEKIRHRVHSTDLSDLTDDDFRISVSIGCSTIDTNNPSIDLALKWADMALYEAKHHGRNQVKSMRSITTIRDLRHH